MNLAKFFTIGTGWCFGFLCCLLPYGALGATASTSPAVSPVHDRAAVEAAVRSFFADVPVMVAIAQCESNFRQFTDSGNVLRSNGMIGVFQFFEAIHVRAATAQGHDLATLEGNLAYARQLYNQSGTQPWAACVPPSQTAPVAPAGEATTELKIALLKQLLGLLQELLRLKLAAQ